MFENKQNARIEFVDTIRRLRSVLDGVRASGESVGLVPTMGALHEGHASLMRTAANDCDVVVATIFVNPLQFAPTEDLASYPRDLGADAEIAQAAGVRYLFTPTVSEMYPFGPANVLTTVSLPALQANLDGLHRPGHFDGVATVVAKLFAVAGPCRAYFGEKDYQQLAIIRRMAVDLSFPVEVVAGETIREASGLALSSRNRYLTDDERARATVIFRALNAGVAAVKQGEVDPATVRAVMHELLRSEPEVEVQYAEVVDAATLVVPQFLSGPVRLLVAARIGAARLIDNMGAIAGSTGSTGSK